MSQTATPKLNSSRPKPSSAIEIRINITRPELFGLPVDADATGAVSDDIEEPTRHHQILVEIYQVSLIADRQMHAKSGAEAEKNEQGRRPSRLEAKEERQAAEQMDGDGDPDSHLGNRHVDAGKILGSGGWVPELQNAVPNKEARHQNTCEWEQVSSHIRNDPSVLTGQP